MTVYFIQSDGPEGFIKIGVTEDVWKRLRALQTSMPHKLALIHDIPGDAKTETEMHVRFLHHHHRGEWFRPGKDLLAFCGIRPPRETRAKPVRARPVPIVPRPRTDCGFPEEALASLEQDIYLRDDRTVPPDTPEWMARQHEAYWAKLDARYYQPWAVAFSASGEAILHAR